MNTLFPSPYNTDNDNNAPVHPKIQLLSHPIRWMTETWRLIVSVVLSLIIYVLFSWFPGPVAFLMTATMLCLFGQYEVQVAKKIN